MNRDAVYMYAAINPFKNREEYKTRVIQKGPYKTAKSSDDDYDDSVPEEGKPKMKKYILIGGSALLVTGIIIFLIKRKK